MKEKRRPIEVRRIHPKRWVAAGHTMMQKGAYGDRRWTVLNREYEPVAETETLHEAIGWVAAAA